MALTGTFNYSGALIPNTYVDVITITGNKNFWRADLGVFTSQPTPNTPPSPLTVVVVNMPYVPGQDPLQTIFPFALTQNAFSAMVADPKPTTISRRDFLNRFTTQERITIRTAANGNDAVACDFIHILDISESVTLTDTQTVDGLNYCVSMGYLSAANANTILTP